PGHHVRRVVRRLCARRGAEGGRLGADRARRCRWRGGGAAGAADDRGGASVSGAPAGIVLDMEGVLHVDWRPIDGSPEAVEELRRRGIELAILTNTTGRTRAAIAARLSAI